MFGSDELYDALNVTGITNLLDTSQSQKGLFDGRILPSWFIGDATINFYLINPFTGYFGPFKEYVYSVDCRAKTDGESRAIAQAVYNEVHRKAYSGYFILCSVLGTLPPSDDTDVFNTPCEVILKSKN
jgi:hypothetical protein